MARRSVDIPETASRVPDRRSCSCYTGRALGGDRFHSVAHVEVDTHSGRNSFPVLVQVNYFVSSQGFSTPLKAAPERSIHIFVSSVKAAS